MIWDRLKIQPWWQFNIRTILLFTILSALILFWFGPEYLVWKQSHESWKIVKQLSKRPPIDTVIFEYQIDENGYFKLETTGKVSRFTNWMGGKRNWKEVVFKDPEKLYPQAARVHPNATVDSVLNLAKDYDDLTFLKPEDQFVDWTIGNPSLQSLNGIQNLHSLETFRVENSPSLHDISDLKALSDLTRVSFVNCDALPFPEIDRLRQALPKTDIQLQGNRFVPILERNLSHGWVTSQSKPYTVKNYQELRWQCLEKKIDGLESLTVEFTDSLIDMKWISNCESLRTFILDTPIAPVLASGGAEDLFALPKLRTLLLENWRFSKEFLSRPRKLSLDELELRCSSNDLAELTRKSGNQKNQNSLRVTEHVKKLTLRIYDSGDMFVDLSLFGAIDDLEIEFEMAPQCAIYGIKKLKSLKISGKNLRHIFLQDMDEIEDLKLVNLPLCKKVSGIESTKIKNKQIVRCPRLH